MDRQYLVRAARFDMQGETFVVIDPSAPRMITLDPWMQTVFLSSDGQHTVADFVEVMGRKYPGGTPPGLAEQVRQIVGRLVSLGLIRLSDTPVVLPHELTVPASAGPR